MSLRGPMGRLLAALDVAPPGEAVKVLAAFRADGVTSWSATGC